MIMKATKILTAIFTSLLMATSFSANSQEINEGKYIVKTNYEVIFNFTHHTEKEPLQFQIQLYKLNKNKYQKTSKVSVYGYWPESASKNGKREVGYIIDLNKYYLNKPKSLDNFLLRISYPTNTNESSPVISEDIIIIADWDGNLMAKYTYLKQRNKQYSPISIY